MVGNMWIGRVSSVNTIESQIPTQIDQQVDECKVGDGNRKAEPRGDSTNLILKIYIFKFNENFFHA